MRDHRERFHVPGAERPTQRLGDIGSPQDGDPHTEVLVQVFVLSDVQDDQRPAKGLDDRAHERFCFGAQGAGACA